MFSERDISKQASKYVSRSFRKTLQMVHGLSHPDDK